MGGSSKGGGNPPQIDPTKIIDAQADANRINQTTPFGSSTWSKSPEGTWTQNISLTPGLQSQITNQQNLGAGGSQAALNMLPGVTQGLSQGFQGSGAASGSNIKTNAPTFFTGAGGAINNPQATATSAQAGAMPKFSDFSNLNLAQAGSTSAGNTKFDRFTAPEFDLDKAYSMAYDPKAALVNKEYDRLDDRTEAKLAAQGLTLGSDAYKTGRNLFDESRNDAYSRLASTALSEGLGAQNQQYGQASNTYGQNFNAANTEVQNQLNQASINNQAASINAQNALAKAGLMSNSDALKLQAQGQGFNQNLANANLANSVAGQNFGQNLAAQGQQFNQGLQANAQNYGQAMGNAQLANQGQSQAYGQQYQQYQQPLQNLQALNSLNNPQSPNFASPTSLDVTGPYNAQYQGQLAAYNNAAGNSQANQGAMFGALGNVAGALPWGQWFSLSTMKDIHGDAEPVLDRLIELPMKQWNYKGDTETHTGPMAEDWQRLFGGNGVTIQAMDVMNVILQSVQELAKAVKRLEAAHG